MGHLIGSFYAYGIVLQLAALVHFVRRRPDTYWLWIIFLGGGLGSLVYLLMEALPDLQLAGSFKLFQGRKRARYLEWLVSENPAPANYEELGSLYMQDRRFAQARECFSKALQARTDSLDPFYRRALCSSALGDDAAAVPDLEHVVRKEPNFDYYRAATLLAECYWRSGQAQKAGALLKEITRECTLTEAQLLYASFLSAQGQMDEARRWAQHILAKKAGMPRFQRRLERPLFRKTEALLKRLAAPGASRVSA